MNNSTMNSRANTSALTGEQTRLLFPHVFEKYAFKPTDKPRYQTCLLIPKSDTATVNRLVKAIGAATEIGSAKVGRTPPWAPGLMLRADGYECPFYQKD